MGPGLTKNSIFRGRKVGQSKWIVGDKWRENLCKLLRTKNLWIQTSDMLSRHSFTSHLDCVAIFKTRFSARINSLHKMRITHINGGINLVNSYTYLNANPVNWTKHKCESWNITLWNFQYPFDQSFLTLHF